jgi:hypothetical protein
MSQGPRGIKLQFTSLEKDNVTMSESKKCYFGNAQICIGKNRLRQSCNKMGT